MGVPFVSDDYGWPDDDFDDEVSYLQVINIIVNVVPLERL